MKKNLLATVLLAVFTIALTGCYTVLQIPVDNNTPQQSDDSLEPTIIIYEPIQPFVQPPVGIPIVRPPVHTPTPVKPEDNNKNTSQKVRPRDNTNNSSTNTRNDNGSRNTDTGRKR